MGSIDWRMAVQLSMVGLCIGLVASFSPLPPPAEFGLWMLAYAAWIWAVRRARPAEPFRTVLAASLLSGVWAAIIPTLFRDAYAANHPELAAQYGAMDTMSYAGMQLGVGLVLGLIFGLVVGFLAQRWARIA